LVADKTYSGTIRLGQVTSTDDAEGDVTSTQEVNCSKNDVLAVLATFTGPISQIPPMFSALKRDGKPLYEYARAGITLELVPRQVRIDFFKLVSFDGTTIEFEVRCSKGTYVRCLARDVGQALGCGAHLSRLRRDAIHHLGQDISLADAYSIDALTAVPEVAARRALLLPVDTLVSGLMRVELQTHEADRFRQGQRLRMPTLTFPSSPPTQPFRVYCGQALLGLARWQDGVLAPQRLVHLSH
jgi:tRNA pseudouridine55 synthase